MGTANVGRRGPRYWRTPATVAVACLGLGAAVRAVWITPAASLAPALAFALSFGLLVQGAVNLRSGARFSSAAVVLPAAALALGPAAAWIVIPGYVVRYIRSGDLGWRMYYTIGQITLSLAVAIAAVPLLGGHFGPVTGEVDALRVLVFFLFYDLLNAAFASGRLLLDQGTAWSATFPRLLLRERGTGQLLYYALAVVAAVLWSDSYWIGLMLMTILGLFLHATLTQAGEAARREQEARTDTLTGVGNRRRLQEWAESAPEMPYGLLFLDLDGLKAFNDGYGHAAGDAALVATAQVLREQTRPGDVLIRYGGDEFVAILLGATAVEAEQTARRIADALGERTMIADGEPTTLHVCVGSAAAPEDGLTLEDLLRRADQAMYSQKLRV